MATLFKNHSKEKLFGQIFTPEFIVKKILDDIGFKSKNLLNKTILDPACGDGRFLIEIVKRIIKYSKQENLIKNLHFVYGWDIDPIAIKACIKNLNSIIKPLNIKIKWNIKCCDTLKKIENYNSLFPNEEFQQFEYIVGNPPYIRIQHLEEEQRKFIQNNYKFCESGSTDIYIAFFEFCLHALTDKGKCALITPNTYFTTETAKKFRKYLENNQNLIKITNYGEIQLFDNATTYSAITIYGKNKNNNFLFEKAISKHKFNTRTISYEEIKNSIFWQLSTNFIPDNNGRKLKEICNIHCGLATLADKAYILKLIDLNKDYICLKSKLTGEKITLEKNILKPIIKASRLKSSNDKITEYIIFPYKKINGKNQIISESELKEKFPNAYEYLLSIKDFLDKRCNGSPNPVAWYAYGRTQALDTSFGKKILFSTMAKKPNFIYSDNEEATFYSGYCIKYDGDYSKLLKLLNSKEMEEFVSISGRDFRDGWKSYSKKIIQEFPINIK